MVAGLSRARLAHRLKGDLDTIALTALKREPERRYATVAAFADDLERFLEGRPVAARPDTLGYRTRKFVSRHRVAVAAALLVSLSLAGGVAAALWQARATRIESERTARVRDFLASIFGSLDPDLGPGRDASAATLLADGAARVEAELGGEPRHRRRALRGARPCLAGARSLRRGRAPGEAQSRARSGERRRRLDPGGDEPGAGGRDRHRARGSPGRGARAARSTRAARAPRRVAPPAAKGSPPPAPRRLWGGI